jgi:hypothetical protein
VSLQPGIDQAEGVEFFNREKPPACQGAVIHGRDMSVGKEEKVLPNPVHIKIRFQIEDFIVQGHEKFGTTQGAARVTGIHFMNHPDYIPSHLGNQVLQRVFFRHFDAILIVAKSTGLGWLLQQELLVFINGNPGLNFIETLRVSFRQDDYLCSLRLRIEVYIRTYGSQK